MFFSSRGRGEGGGGSALHVTGGFNCFFRTVEARAPPKECVGDPLYAYVHTCMSRGEGFLLRARCLLDDQTAVFRSVALLCRWVRERREEREGGASAGLAQRCE